MLKASFALLLSCHLLGSPPRKAVHPVAEKMVDPKDVKAENVAILNLRRVDGESRAPDCSPTEDLVAYQRVEEIRGVEKHSIWISDFSGGRKERIAEEGSRPAWSPDGKRIVYLAGTVVMVSDRATHRNIPVYDLGREFPVWNAYPRWTVDGSRLVVGDHIIDLDSLKLFRNTAMNAPGAEEWLRENRFGIRHPNLRLYISEYNPDGLWVSSSDEGYRRLLVPGLRQGFAVSRDATKIVLAGSTPGGRGLFVASLGTERTLQTEFAVRLGKEAILRAFDYSRASPGENGWERCLRGKSIFATAAASRSNPLNGKLLGAGREKGILRIVKASPRFSIVRVVSQTEPIAAGDVMGAMWASDGKSRGCSGRPEAHEWAVLEEATPEALVGCEELNLQNGARSEPETVGRSEAREAGRASCGSFASCLSAGKKAAGERAWQIAAEAYRGATVADPSQEAGWQGFATMLLAAGRPAEEVAKAWDQILENGKTLLFEACKEDLLGCNYGELAVSKAAISYSNWKGKQVFNVPPVDVEAGPPKATKFLALDRVAFPLKVQGKSYSFQYIPPGGWDCMNKTDLTRCVTNGAYQQRIVAEYVLGKIASLRSGASQQ